MVVCVIAFGASQIAYCLMQIIHSTTDCFDVSNATTLISLCENCVINRDKKTVRWNYEYICVAEHNIKHDNSVSIEFLYIAFILLVLLLYAIRPLRIQKHQHIRTSLT